VLFEIRPSLLHTSPIAWQKKQLLFTAYLPGSNQGTATVRAGFAKKNRNQISCCSLRIFSSFGV